ncbi:MAG: chemotaxis protein CheR [Nitrospirota bacterium]|nr:chemotaxis protein CheR [Nitrospirota bacterium]MDH5585157.1 chemotaxis protein CheR [Nitrospirota bacterium]MDH5773365.1 chemotaxis protein CheR [Nitrospirota bacterium]
MEGTQEGPTTANQSVGAETIVAWIGARISSSCGITVSQEDTHKLSLLIHNRMAALSVNDPIRYFQLVESRSAAGVAEWEHLLSRLTNGETFFFRDSGQIALLRDHILPELIGRRNATKTLRVWSAGCSTGEETYSLAMLVDQLLPDRHDWDISILGTDINVRALHHAQRGQYGQWAFRKIDPVLQQRYFTQTASQWILEDSIREMVMFRPCNLVTATFDSSVLGIDAFDLILCRNVFLYFHTDAICHVMKKIASALVRDGYFLTGHGELPPQTVGDLQAKIYPESVIYQLPQTAGAVASGSGW